MQTHQLFDSTDDVQRPVTTSIGQAFDISRTTLSRRIRFLAEQAQIRCWKETVRRVRRVGLFNQLQFDDLHNFEHTSLVRRTWCTTKINARLDDHLAMYVDYHNRVLLKQLTH